MTSDKTLGKPSTTVIKLENMAKNSVTPMMNPPVDPSMLVYASSRCCENPLAEVGSGTSVPKKNTAPMTKNRIARTVVEK